MNAQPVKDGKDAFTEARARDTISTIYQIAHQGADSAVHNEGLHRLVAQNEGTHVGGIQFGG